jgi:hypothetical protein
MIIKRCASIVVLLMILLSHAIAAEKEIGGIWLDDSSMSQMALPQNGDIPFLLADFEYPQNEKTKVFQYDFNRDGFRDYLVESWKSLCGTGGCLYALIDGKTKKRIGDFFGAPILVLDQTINGFPVIQSYSHLSANSGGFTTYVFDGSKYQVVSSVYVEGKSLDELFKKLEGFRKVTLRK